MKHRPIRPLKLLPMPLPLCRENDIRIWALPSWIYVKMAGHWNNEKSEFIVWFLAVIIKFSESQLSSTSNEWKKVTTVVNTVPLKKFATTAKRQTPLTALGGFGAAGRLELSVASRQTPSALSGTVSMAFHLKTTCKKSGVFLEIQ